MGDTTNIAWTDKTWNPVRGCTKISPGCSRCYMFREQRRYGRDPSQVVRCGKEIWKRPFKWNAEAIESGDRVLVFTCSWSDWFHEDVDRWRDEMWEVIRLTPHLTYQILTKRAERIADNLPADWGDGYRNVWLGVSIENQHYEWRKIRLQCIPARVRFISYEPALGPLELDLSGIHQVIYGGESGPTFRPDRVEWAQSMRDQCRKAGVAFFHKQRSGPRPGMYPELDGEIIQEYPK